MNQLPAPNGQPVTQAQLYKALYDLDQNMAEAFTQIHEGMNDIRGDFERHREDGHPYTDKAAVVKEQIGLDAKKAGIATGILAVAATIGALALKAAEVLL